MNNLHTYAAFLIEGLRKGLRNIINLCVRSFVMAIVGDIALLSFIA